MKPTTADIQIITDAGFHDIGGAWVRMGDDKLYDTQEALSIIQYEILIDNSEAFVESVFERQARGIALSRPRNMWHETKMLGELYKGRDAIMKIGG